MQKFPHTVALAYCVDNEMVAKKIAEDLSPAIDFKLFTHPQDSTSNLNAHLTGFAGPIILLVSDNFLRAVTCMEQGLSFLNVHQHDILPIIIPGQKMNDAGVQEAIPTKLERVSDIIQYINYWQDRYLDLRRQKKDDDELAKDDGFINYVKRVREISGQVGEYIRLLRGVWHLSLQEFTHNRYQQLFIFLDDTSLGDTFRAISPAEVPLETSGTEPVKEIEDVKPEEEKEEEPEIDISGIPGLNMLEKVTPEEDLTTYEDATEVEPLPSEENLVEEPGIISAPEEIEELIEKAWKITEEGAFEEGLNILAPAVARYPSEVDLRYSYSIMLAQAGQSEAATTEVEKILAAAPTHADALFLAGELADMRGDGIAARDYFQQILLLNDELSEVWFQLGMIQLTHFPKETEATEKAFKKAYKFDKTNTEALYQLAQFYLRNGREEKAIKRLEQLLKQEPDRAAARYDLALLYHRQGNLVAAQTAYLQAAGLKPELRTTTNDQAFQVGTNLVTTESNAEELEQLRARIAELEVALEDAQTQAAVEPEPAVVEPEELPKPGAGKVVMITGATSGIGKATAHKFAELGFNLIITGRRAERLDVLAAEWHKNYGVQVKPLVFDVRDAKAVAEAIGTLDGDWQAIDILVNNAGKAKGLDVIQEGNLAHWDEMVDTNIKGLLYVSRAVLPLMVKRESGHVINLCSTAGKEVYPKGAVYCATKHAVDALTQGMRLDLHTYGIRVSQVCPAHVEETEFAEVRFDGDKQRAKIYEDFQPLRSPDVAEMIAFLVLQPPHVNVLDVIMQGTQQASSTVIDRSGREKYALVVR